MTVLLAVHSLQGRIQRSPQLLRRSENDRTTDVQHVCSDVAAIQNTFFFSEIALHATVGRVERLKGRPDVDVTKWYAGPGKFQRGFSFSQELILARSPETFNLERSVVRKSLIDKIESNPESGQCVLQQLHLFRALSRPSASFNPKRSRYSQRDTEGGPHHIRIYEQGTQRLSPQRAGHGVSANCARQPASANLLPVHRHVHSVGHRTWNCQSNREGGLV